MPISAIALGNDSRLRHLLVRLVKIFETLIYFVWTLTPWRLAPAVFLRPLERFARKYMS
jgi:hypothetical protein